jgi:hypothetical protein
MAKMLRPALFVAFLAWMAIWFWAFSLAYSSSFFQYDLGTRLPFLFLSLLAVAVPPPSSYWVVSRTIRMKSSATRAGLINLVVSALPLLLFSAVYFLWVYLFQGPGRVAFEADEAMAIGIDFALCMGVFVATNVLLWLVFFGIQVLGRRDGVT